MEFNPKILGNSGFPHIGIQGMMFTIPVEG